MPIFKKQQRGCLGVKPDSRNYHRPFLFGAEPRITPEEFVAKYLPEITDQLKTMACTFFSYFGQALPIKVFIKTGKHIIVTNDMIRQFWDDACEKGYADAKIGAYIEDPCRYNQKYLKTFATTEGVDITVKCDKYFIVPDGQADEEMYYGGAVLTGTSSRAGLDVAAAGSSPYFIASRKQAKNDGHAHPEIGKQKRKIYSAATRTWSSVIAWVHPNSWGKTWGDAGYMYSRGDQQKILFPKIGFTIICSTPGDGPGDWDSDTGNTGTFKDVGEKSWYFEAIEAAVKSGAIEGYPDGTFRPAEPMNRAEVCAVLHRIGLFDREE